MISKKIVITGGLGYIGTELCKIYSGISWNNQILVLDNRTIFKGIAPTGHGALKPSSRRGCGTTKCNSFPISIINDQTPVSCECLPTSAFTTKGLLLSKIYNPTQSSNDYLGQSGCPKNSKCPDWVVKNFNPLDHSQTSYIRKLKVKTASEAAEICKKKCFPAKTGKKHR